MILAFDTSGPHCATALLDGDTIRTQRFEPMAKGQVEHLMPLIDATLAAAQITPQDLTALGVGIGPGNFTGIRISVAAARGLALSLGIPAIGVSSLEALAYGAPRPVIASIDARQDKLYLQTFAPGAEAPPALTTLEDAVLPQADSVGHRADEIAARTGGRALQPAHSVAEAIARIAATRLSQTNPRPAPLYIRPADAAPSRATGPTIL